MLISPVKVKVTQSYNILDLQVMVELSIYSILPSKPVNEKISVGMAHWVVSLHEADEGNSLPHNMDIWKMSPKNNWP